MKLENTLKRLLRKYLVANAVVHMLLSGNLETKLLNNQEKLILSKSQSLKD